VLRRDEAVGRVQGRQPAIGLAQQGRYGHAVNIAGRGGFKGMGIHMCIDPDQSQVLCFRQGLQNAGPGAHGAGMIAADHQERAAGFGPVPGQPAGLPVEPIQLFIL
jgi:hypothetical protein